jgi:hypothetical protein
LENILPETVSSKFREILTFRNSYLAIFIETSFPSSFWRGSEEAGLKDGKLCVSTTTRSKFYFPLNNGISEILYHIILQENLV